MIKELINLESIAIKINIYLNSDITDIIYDYNKIKNSISKQFNTE